MKEPQFVIVWRNGDTPGKEISTYLHNRRVLTFPASAVEVQRAKKVDMAEEAGELLEPGNGRKIAVPVEAAKLFLPDQEFVEAASLL
jgi:hypothetical protein